MQRLERILAQTAAPKVPEWPSYNNFCKVNSSPRLKSAKNSEANGIILLFACTYSAKNGEYFGANSGSKSVRMGKLWQLSQGHPKPAFSEKVQRGDQRKFFKNRPKSSLRLKGLKALWRKLNYTSIKMHLKWKDWKRFCRKRRLQKCPNGQVIANFARLPETRIF